MPNGYLEMKDPHVRACSCELFLFSCRGPHHVHDLERRDLLRVWLRGE